MTTDELLRRYHRLRQALEAAYAASPWNSQRIDCITAQMLPLERALGSLHAAWEPELPLCRAEQRNLVV